MEEFPSNSYKSREGRAKPPVEEKNVKRIVEGEVIRRKKPFSRRLASYFFGTDARGAMAQVAADTLLPMIRDGFIESFHAGIDHMFGNDRRHYRRGGHRPGGGSYVSYNRYSSRDRDRRDDRDEVRHMSRRGRATHDFDEIILPSRIRAEEVLDQLYELVSKYEVATVRDLYEMVGIISSHTDEKWGWEDLRGAGAVKVRGGYLLDLPKPEPID